MSIIETNQTLNDFLDLYVEKTISARNAWDSAESAHRREKYAQERLENLEKQSKEEAKSAEGRIDRLRMANETVNLDLSNTREELTKTKDTLASKEKTLSVLVEVLTGENGLDWKNAEDLINEVCQVLINAGYDIAENKTTEQADD